MSADAATLTKALQFALALLKDDPTLTRLAAAERAAQEFNLGPLDEDWLLNHLTARLPPE
jgi:hypothetical protein